MGHALVLRERITNTKQLLYFAAVTSGNNDIGIIFSSCLTIMTHSLRHVKLLSLNNNALLLFICALAFSLQFPRFVHTVASCHFAVRNMVVMLASSEVLFINADQFSSDVFTQTKPLKDECKRDKILPRRKVQFAAGEPEVSYYIGGEDLPEESRFIKWLSTTELQQIQHDIKVFRTQLCRHKHGYDHELTLAHHKVTLMLKSDFRLLLKLSRTLPDQDLFKWCAYNDGRRGLERFVSQIYSAFRQGDMVKTRQAVLIEQAGQRDAGLNDPNAIAKASQFASCRARSFAHLLAVADANMILKPQLADCHGGKRKRNCVADL